MATHTPRRRPAEPVASELGSLLGQARRTVWAELARGLAARGVSAHAWQLLNRLSHLGTATQVQLAEATAQHPAAISRLLDEVEQAGLVLRQRSRTDRRKQTVQLSAQGKARVRALRPEVAGAVERASRRLSASEQARLCALLRKLIGPDGE